MHIIVLYRLCHLWNLVWNIEHCNWSRQRAPSSTQCGNFMIFLLIRFYVKSILGRLSFKCAVLDILEALSLVILVIFCLWTMQKLIENQIYELKVADYESLDSPILILRKICRRKGPEISTQWMKIGVDVKVKLNLLLDLECWNQPNFFSVFHGFRFWVFVYQRKLSVFLNWAHAFTKIKTKTPADVLSSFGNQNKTENKHFTRLIFTAQNQIQIE